jgi:hypothetical protein
MVTTSIGHNEICKMWPRLWPQWKTGPVPGAIFQPKLLILLAPRAGFEPATNRLTEI